MTYKKWMNNTDRKYNTSIKSSVYNFYDEYMSFQNEKVNSLVERGLVGEPLEFLSSDITRNYIKTHKGYIVVRECDDEVLTKNIKEMVKEKLRGNI